MAIARITTQDATGTGTGSASATYAATPTSGNLLIAVIGNDNLTLSLTNSGWTLGPSTSSSINELNLYYKVAGVSEPTVVTMTTDAGASKSSIAIYEYNGFTGTPTLDQSTIGGAFSTATLTCDCGTTAATTVANELVFASALWNGAETLSSWTNTFTARNSVGGHLFTSDKIVAATAAYQTTATVTGTAGANSGVIATFKSAGAAAPAAHNLTLLGVGS